MLRLSMLYLLMLCIPANASESTAAKVGERKLFSDLFANYVPEVRPRIDPTQNVSVTADLDLHHIKHLDEKQQILHIVAFVEARWTDDYLAWTPSNYGGVRELIIPPSKIWLPDFGIVNSAGSFYQGSFYEYFRVRVDYTGLVDWSFGGPLQITCPMDTTLYPFDRQRCSLILENWAYSVDYVDLRNRSDNLRMDDHHDSGVWQLVGTEVLRKETTYCVRPGVFYPQLFFIVHLQRKPRYYLINVTLPCVFLTCIALLVYWLPPEAGEKVSLGVTALLAFSVLQLVISDSTPENSDVTPILTMFVSLTMSMSTMSVIITVLVLYLHHTSRAIPPPRWIQRLAFNILAPALCMHLPVTLSSSSAMRGRQSAEVVPMTSPTPEVPGDNIDNSVSCGRDIICFQSTAQSCSRIDEILAELCKITSRLEAREAESAVNEQWRALAKVLDRLMFCITLLMLLLGVLGMTVISLRQYSRLPGY